jgi:hypothetical protein
VDPTQTKLSIAVKGIQQPDDARFAIDNGADVLYCTNHGGRQANSGISTLQHYGRQGYRSQTQYALFLDLDAVEIAASVSHVHVMTLHRLLSVWSR